MVDGATRVLGIEAAAKEVGIIGRGVEVETDSSVAKSYASRRGVRRVKHVEVKMLWLQNALKEGQVIWKKLKGTENLADQMAEHLDVHELRRGAMALRMTFGHDALGGRDHEHGGARGGV